MLTLLQTETVGHPENHSAAAALDAAVKRFASVIDVSDTDEGMERVQTAANAAVLDALIYVARQNGWQAGRLGVLRAEGDKVTMTVTFS